MTLIEIMIQYAATMREGEDGKRWLDSIGLDSHMIEEVTNSVDEEGNYITSGGRYSSLHNLSVSFESDRHM